MNPEAAAGSPMHWLCFFGLLAGAAGPAGAVLDALGRDDECTGSAGAP